MRRFKHNPRERGFSLIEMMIAAAIFILLCGAAFALLSLAQQRYQTESQVLNSFQEARFGLDDIVRDVNGSGFPPANMFSFSSSSFPPQNLYAVTPVAWAPGYPSNTTCQIGAGSPLCTTPGDFDLIIERDPNLSQNLGVQWTRYQLQGTTLMRGQAGKSQSPGGDPDGTTSTTFVPYVQNVMNNAPAAQIAQFRAVYPQMFPGGNPVPIFNYYCPNPAPPPDTVACSLAGAYNSPQNVTDIEVTLIVMAPSLDAQTAAPRLVELHGRGHSFSALP